MLEMIILHDSWISPYPVYPYSIHKKLVKIWEEEAPSLPTIYSAIKRLESNNFIRYKEEIRGGRVQKQILINDSDASGFDLLQAMEKEFENIPGFLEELKDVRHYEP